MNRCEHIRPKLSLFICHSCSRRSNTKRRTTRLFYVCFLSFLTKAFVLLISFIGKFEKFKYFKILKLNFLFFKGIWERLNHARMISCQCDIVYCTRHCFTFLTSPWSRKLSKRCFLLKKLISSLPKLKRPKIM